MDKYFILDKEYAKQCISRCVGIFEEEPTKEQIDQSVEEYNANGYLLYFGEDVPHYFKYNEKNNSIEPIEHKYDEPIEEPEKVFDDEVITEEDEFYFYIYKKIAEEKGIAIIRAATKQKIINYISYFGDDNVVMAKLNTQPYYVVLIDESTFRVATKYERYLSGNYILQPNEYVDGDEIKELKEGEYYSGSVVVNVKKNDIPMSQYWDFEKRKWVFSETELQAINRIEDELIECMNEIKTRKEIGLGFEVAEKKYKRLLEDHQIVSEIYATKKNEKI